MRRCCLGKSSVRQTRWQMARARYRAGVLWASANNASGTNEWRLALKAAARAASQKGPKLLGGFAVALAGCFALERVCAAAAQALRACTSAPTFQRRPSVARARLKGAQPLQFKALLRRGSEWPGVRPKRERFSPPISKESNDTDFSP